MVEQYCVGRHSKFQNLAMIAIFDEEGMDDDTGVFIQGWRLKGG